MRALTTIAYGIAAAFALVATAAAVIGHPDPSEARHGGLTAATVLRSDGSRSDAPRSPPLAVESPSS